MLPRPNASPVASESSDFEFPTFTGPPLSETGIQGHYQRIIKESNDPAVQDALAFLARSSLSINMNTIVSGTGEDPVKVYLTHVSGEPVSWKTPEMICWERDFSQYTYPPEQAVLEAARTLRNPNTTLRFGDFPDGVRLLHSNPSTDSFVEKGVAE